MKVTAYDPKKKKLVYVGIYDPFTNILTLPKTSKHFMVKENGYGIQWNIYERALKRDCIIHIKKGERVFESHIEDWHTRGHEADYGHGRQVFLDVKLMTELITK